MSNILSTWKIERINYQRRYANHVLIYDKNPNDETNRGAMLEASYVLINIFGLTEEQVKEVERNQGFIDNDLR